MQQVRKVPFFDIYPVDFVKVRESFAKTDDILPSARLSSNSQHSPSPSSDISCVAKSRQFIWIGHSNGCLTRASLVYINPSQSDPICTTSEPIFENNEKQLSEEQNACSFSFSKTECSSDVLGKSSDSVLSAKEICVYKLFNSRVTHIMVSSTEQNILPVLQGSLESSKFSNEVKAKHDVVDNQMQDYEVLVTIGQQLGSSCDWKCKIFLLSPDGHLIGSKITSMLNGKPHRSIFTFTGCNILVNDSCLTSPLVEPFKEINFMDSQTQIQIQQEKPIELLPLTVVCAAINSRATKLAVGFSNGTVIYYYCGDLRNIESSVKGRRLHLYPLNESGINDSCKTTPDSNPHDPITNLLFGYSMVHNSEILFVTTTQSIISVLAPCSIKQENLILFHDPSGGAVSDCATCVPSSLHQINDGLCILRNNALFVYNAEQGNLSALPCGSGSLCRGFRYYCCIVTHNTQSTPALTHNNNNNNHYITIPMGSTVLPTSNLTVILNMPSLRLVGFTCRISNVISILPIDQTSILILTKSGVDNQSIVVFELRERSSVSRIEALLQKRMFEWAIELCVADHLPEEITAEIHTLHGDWLFDKSRFDDAAQVYLQTIGSLEPSHVIAKFLSKQQFNGLITYLQALYKKKLATKTHLVLLFKCFCYRNDSEGFSAFLDSAERLDAPQFDWSVAIEECRMSGYFELAKKIATQAHLTAPLLSILLDDLNDVTGALELLNRIREPEACTLLLQTSIGNKLLRAEPEKTLNLICHIIDTERLDIALFIPIFMDIQPQKVIPQELSSDSVSTTNLVSTKQIEPGRLSLIHRQRGSLSTTNNALDSLLVDFVLSYLNRVMKDVEGSPPVGFAALSISLEILLRRYSNEKYQKHLNHGCTHKPDQYNIEDLEKKIDGIIRYHVKSDEALLSAFCLSSIYNYGKALILICERIAALFGSRCLNLTARPLWPAGALQAPLMLQNIESETLVTYTLRCGVKDSTFWRLAFPSFSRPPHCYAVRHLLHRIENAGGICPKPLTVVRLLTNSDAPINSTRRGLNAEQEKTITVGDVREYLLNSLSQLKDNVNRLKKKADTDVSDLQLQREGLRSISQDLQYFHVLGQSCSHCGTLLDLPIIRFLCGHTFHRLCLPNSETPTCIKCSRGNEVKQANVDHLLNLDSIELLKEIQAKEKSYVSTISQLISRGLLRGTHYTSA